MTVEVAVLLAILGVMALLFVTEKLPIEITAFSGLIVCLMLGYLRADEAFNGFGSPAVITMLGVFFLGAALHQTGVADLIGGRLERFAGGRPVRLVVMIMLVAALLSAFMNNIAAVAVLMPAVGSISRRSGISPGRLFMPLSFGAILGGTTTLVGTPPNIVAADILEQQGLEPFSLFDFTPIGLVLLVTGIIFMVTWGARLLPAAKHQETRGEGEGSSGLVRLYRTDEDLVSLRVPEGSALHGRTIRESRFGTELGAQVVTLIREGKRHAAPEPDEVIEVDDVLVLHGPKQRIEALLPIADVSVAAYPPSMLDGRPGNGEMQSATVRVGASVVGRSLADLDFRQRHGLVVLGIRRGGGLVSLDMGEMPLSAGDELLLLTTGRSGAPLPDEDFETRPLGASHLTRLEGRLFSLAVAPSSPTVGRSVADCGLEQAVGLNIVGLVRGPTRRFPVARDEVIQAGDRLLVITEPDRLKALLAMGQLQLDASQGGLSGELGSEDVGVFEVAVAPRSRAMGRTLTQLRFREKYGFNVLSLWREGRALAHHAGGITLRFGDGLLLQGPMNRLEVLASDPDFVVLDQSVQIPKRKSRAALSVGALLVMILMVVTGFQPIQVAAFTAGTLVLLGGALTMEEGYRAVEWRAIFLVACVLPLGGALTSTGAADLLASTVTSTLGPLGPHAVLAGFVILASLTSQALDGAPAVVLIAPIALRTVAELDISPYPVIMAISLAASAAYLTPFSHKANLLVMGPGGYRVIDFVRVGTPLTVLQLVLLVLLVPVLMPL